MANIKSQIKRNRQTLKRHERNKAVKSALKTELKKFHNAVDAGDKDAVAAQLRVATRELDRAVTKGVLHKNAAANKKSGLAKKAQAV